MRIRGAAVLGAVLACACASQHGDEQRQIDRLNAANAAHTEQQQQEQAAAQPAAPAQDPNAADRQYVASENARREQADRDADAAKADHAQIPERLRQKREQEAADEKVRSHEAAVTTYRQHCKASTTPSSQAVTVPECPGTYYYCMSAVTDENHREMMREAAAYLCAKSKANPSAASHPPQ